MRWSSTKVLSLVAFVVVAAAPTGCNESATPTEPAAVVSTPAPTPAPTPGPAQTWTGTFSGISIPCTSSASANYYGGGPLPTQATVGCLGGRILLDLSSAGNALTGYALWGDPEFYPITGTLTDSAMDVTIFNDTADFPTGPTGPIGTMHLHP